MHTHRKSNEVADVIPVHLRSTFLRAWHLRVRKHNPAHAMIRYMPRRAWWPDVRDDIQLCCDSCPVCQAERGTVKHAEYFQNLPVRVGDVMHADWFTYLGRKYQLVIDDLSGFMFCRRCDNTAEAAIAFLRELFAIVRPWCLVTDHGDGFGHDNFTQYLSAQGVAHITALPYTPEMNGAAERAVQQVKIELDKLVNSYKTAGVEVDQLPDTELWKVLEVLRQSPREELSDLTPQQVFFGAGGRSLASTVLPGFTTSEELQARLLNRATMSAAEESTRKKLLARLQAIRDATRFKARIARAEARDESNACDDGEQRLQHPSVPGDRRCESSQEGIATGLDAKVHRRETP